VLEHAPLVIVHRSVTEVPTVKPVTPLVLDVGVVTDAPFADPTIDQAPVPITGLLAASVKDPLLQLERSVPALAGVGAASIVTVTSSETALHGPDGSSVVSRSVYVPATVAVNVTLAGVAVCALLLNTPSPPAGELNIDHAPVVAAPPTDDPVSVNVPAHPLLSEPALTVAAGLTVITTSSKLEAHGPVGSSVVNLSVNDPEAVAEKFTNSGFVV
jgi:hypothetical protein